MLMFKNIIDDFIKSLNNNTSLFKMDKKNMNTANFMNASVLMISGSHNWSEMSKQIGEHFDIKHNPEIKKILDKTEESEKKKNPVNILRWLGNTSTVILNYINNKTENTSCKLKLTLLQASIILLFNNVDTLTLDEIYKSLLNTSNEQLNEYIKKACESLANVSLLNKQNDSYKINKEFESTTNTLDVTKYMFNKEIKKIEKKVITSEIEYDRVNTINCYIMKCVKQLQKMYFQFDEIKRYIKQELKIFNFTDDDIHSSLKKLVKNYYLDEKNGTYRYEQE